MERCDSGIHAHPDLNSGGKGWRSVRLGEKRCAGESAGCSKRVARIDLSCVYLPANFDEGRCEGVPTGSRRLMP